MLEQKHMPETTPRALEPLRFQQLLLLSAVPRTVLYIFLQPNALRQNIYKYITSKEVWFLELIYSPKGKFQDEKMSTRPRGSGTISAVLSRAIFGSLAYQP